MMSKSNNSMSLISASIMSADPKNMTMTVSGATYTSLFVPGYLMIDFANDLIVDPNRILGQGGTSMIFFGKFQNIQLIAKYGKTDLVRLLFKNRPSNA